MDGLVFKDDVFAIKERLDKVEADLRSQIDELAIKEEEWNQMDRTAEEIKKNHNVIVKFNVCGKKFQTRVETLLNTKDTLFYKMIISKVIELDGEEIFFDRDPKYFGIILDFLRTKRIDLKRFKGKELSDLRREAEFFEITEINDFFGNKPTEIEFVSYEFNGPYVVSGVNVGTNKIDDITDISGMKGICANYPGWIIIELNDEFDINGLDILGFKGNTSYWSPDNGAGATIYVSTDKSSWNQVGTIPSGYGTSIKTVTFSESRAKFIKFQYTSYLGVGYLKLHRV